MPIYSRHQIFCVPKEIIEKKFKGGIDGFRSLFIKEEFKANKEDDHLFCIVESEENFKTLENNGLSFEENDFEFISRYDKGPNLISLASNYAWVYHISTPKIQVVLVNYLCSMTMDVIGKKVEEGVILDETITDKTINTNKFYQEVLNNLSKEEKAKLSFDKFNGSGLANKNDFKYNNMPESPKFYYDEKMMDKNFDTEYLKSYIKPSMNKHYDIESSFFKGKEEKIRILEDKINSLRKEFYNSYGKFPLKYSVVYKIVWKFNAFEAWLSFIYKLTSKFKNDEIIFENAIKDTWYAEYNLLENPINEWFNKDGELKAEILFCSGVTGIFGEKKMILSFLNNNKQTIKVAREELKKSLRKLNEKNKFLDDNIMRERINDYRKI